MNYHYYRPQLSASAPRQPEAGLPARVQPRALQRAEAPAAASAHASTARAASRSQDGTSPAPWRRVTRAFAAAAAPCGLPPPQVSMRQLACQGLPAPQLRALSLEDADRLACSLLPEAKTSYLYLQLCSEKYHRQLMQLQVGVHAFLMAAQHEPKHFNGGECPADVAQACEQAVWSFSTFYAEQASNLPCPNWPNAYLIVTQLECGRALCDALDAYTDVLEDADEASEAPGPAEASQDRALTQLHEAYAQFNTTLVAHPADVPSVVCTHAPS